MSWTKEDVINKYRLTLKEISDIELTSDKTRRLRWRELQKIKKWLESQFYKFEIKKEEL
jgi:hypothetical protein